ncbi:MAG: hypothetical protein AB1801_16005, partial [Chloroflexota bacterium]
MATGARGPLFLAAGLVILACSFDSYLPGKFGAGAAPTPAPTAMQFPIGSKSVSDGLTTLSSYRANLIVEFAGRRGDQPAGGKIESLSEVTRRPAALRQYVKTDLTTPTPRFADGIMEFIRVENTVYVKKADQPAWLSLSHSDASAADFDLPALERLIFLPSAVSSPPQFETLQELSVQHYRFDESDLSNPNVIFEQAQGDLWLTTHGQFLAQYVISASVRVVIPDPQADLFDRGQLNLRYTLTDINGEFTIQPPSTPETGPDTLANLPRLADAELISVLPTLIEYTSAISSISATLFYRDELGARQWTEEQADLFNNKSQLRFSKNGQTLT